MSVDTSITSQVLTIAEDLFTAMIDGEPGTIRLRGPVPIELVDPLHAWVDVLGAQPVRALLAAERDTADRLARALLDMRPDEAVGTEDLVDALGEVANVVGGNFKSLLPQAGSLTLTLPQVDLNPPGFRGVKLHEVQLDWRGAGIFISIWTLDGTEAEKK